MKVKRKSSASTKKSSMDTSRVGSWVGSTHPKRNSTCSEVLLDGRIAARYPCPRHEDHRLPASRSHQDARAAAQHLGWTVHRLARQVQGRRQDPPAGHLEELPRRGGG